MDLTIALLPCTLDLESVKSLSECVQKNLTQNAIEFHQCENTPHISLFQMRIEGEGKKLSELKEAFRKGSQSYKAFSLPFQNFLNLSGKNIFWTVDRTNQLYELEKLHGDVVETVKSYRSSRPLQQIEQDPTPLTQDQQKLMENYGVFWGCPGETFNPHFTLAYNINLVPQVVDAINSFQIPSTFSGPDNYKVTFNRLVVGKIEFHGNLVKVLEEVVLQ